jgi:diadenosine tetraphosphate (Ap4A) HIT family hydrolase
LNKISSLYELIKQRYKRENRSLEIIADWDEVIQPFQPLAVWKIGEFQDKSFEDFFIRFWEIAEGRRSFTSDWKIRGLDGNETEKKAFEKYLKVLNSGISKKYSKNSQEIEERWKNYYLSPEWVETITNAPFLSPAEDLLNAYKEGLINKLVLISSYRKGRANGQGVVRKKKVFARTFGKFPHCSLELTEGSSDDWGRVHPHRWEVLRDKFPTFDILVDDNPQIVKECVENLPADKIYAINDYASNRSLIGDNIYHVKTTVSDMTDERFKEAEEELTKKFSFYSLIKKTYQEKNHPIKIISDWDECIQPLKPMAVYEFGEGKLGTFEEFFKLFWESAVVEGSPSRENTGISKLEGDENVKEAHRKYSEMRKTMRDSLENYQKSLYGHSRRWKVPLTLIGEGIYKGLKEGLISELLVISSYRAGRPNNIEGKRDKIQRTFGKFLQTRIELTEIAKRNGKFSPRRWERIKEIMPDFDILVDDSKGVIKECQENLPSGKVYAAPDYNANRDLKNTHLVSVGLSNIKDEDFNSQASKKCTLCEVCKVNKNRKKPPASTSIEERGAAQEVFITENEDSLIVADRQPRSKGHMMVVPKKHCSTAEDLELTVWNSFLPLIKETIRRIDKVYQPVGYNLQVYNGSEPLKLQSIPHLHFHIIPIYQKKYGHNWLACRLLRKAGGQGLEPTSQEWKEAKKKLWVEPNIVGETDKAIACLEDREKAISYGHIVIRPKRSIPNEINQIDDETWNQLGKLLQDSIQKLKKIDARNFTLHIPIGKLSGPRQENVSWLELHLVPIKVDNLVYADSYGQGSIREYKRIAEKIRDVDKYDDKKPKKITSFWKQPDFYYGLVSGLGIALLGFGVYWLIKKKR